MAEISEKVARWVCVALYRDPDDYFYQPAHNWPDLPVAVFTEVRRLTKAPLWRIVQRAAAEAEEKP